MVAGGSTGTKALLWLAVPSRWTGWPIARARLAAGALALLLLASLTALFAPAPPPASGAPSQRADEQADVVLYESIVAGLRAGGQYYAVTADALRRGDYPLRPFVTFRLPTLAMVQALLPGWLMLILQYALAGGIFAAWALRLRPAIARAPPLAIALALLAGGMMAFVQADLSAFHEIWAGMLIALALALRGPGNWLSAVALGLVAMLVRETAALFVLIMAALALWEGHRREAAAWGATLAIFAVIIAIHAYAVAAVINPGDPASPGWAGFNGFGFFIRTMTISTALALAPLWAGALLVALALFGWASWRDPLSVRMLAVIAAYAMLISLFGRVDTFYWGLMIAPALLVGLAFVPDGLRDLWAAANPPRRRITVKRVSPGGSI